MRGEGNPREQENFDVRLLEREEELHTLIDALARVSTHGGHIMFIHGEAGIGKSSVVDTFVQGAANTADVAIGYCDPLSTPRPLGPVRDMSRTLLGPHDASAAERQCFDLLAEHALQSKRALVWVLEDLHWADQRTLDWLVFIGRRISQLPILLIGTYRDDEVGPSHPLKAASGSLPSRRVTHLSLQPLTVQAIEALGNRRTEVAQALHDITHGNPFFVTELLLHDHSTGPGTVPRTVADAVQLRLSRQPDHLKRFLSLIACCPYGLNPKATERIPGYANAGALLDDGVLAGMLVSTGDDYHFRHELARLATMNALTPQVRRDNHRLFLQALLQSDAEPDLDHVVHHALGAGDDDAVLRYAPEAARKAAALGAHKEAAAYLSHALQRAAGASSEVQATINETWAYETGLAWAIDDEVIAARERAVALWTELDRPEQIAENQRWLSRLHWYRGEAALAQHFVHKAIATLEQRVPGNKAALAKAYALRAQFFMLQDHMDEAVAWGRKALTLAEASKETEVQAHSLNSIGTALLFRAHREGEDLLRRSLAVSLAHGHHEQAARVYTNLSECLIELGDLEKAESVVEEGIRFDTSHDLDAWTYYLVGRKAQLRFEQDRYEEAMWIAQDALGAGDQTLLMRMPAMLIRARCAIRLGKPEARDWLDETVQGALQIDEPQYIVSAQTARLEAALLWRETPMVSQVLHWLAGLDPTQLGPRKRGELVFWLKLAGEATPTTLVGEMPEGFAFFASGRPAESAEWFEQRGARYLAAWAWQATGLAPQRQHATNLIDAVGATGVAAFSVQQTRPSGRGMSRKTKAHPYGLTAQEQVILQMMANGLSNPAIAAQLSRSRRTVENHVSSILDKLSCRNRMEVVLRTQSEPWLLGSATGTVSG